MTNSDNEEASDLGSHVDENTGYSLVDVKPELSLEMLNGKLEELFKEVHANTAAVKLITDNTNNYANKQEKEIDLSNLKRQNLRLLDENIDLRRENDNLKERVNNLSYILADMQGKTKNAEDEKNSLITAMRLLFEDSNSKGEPVSTNQHDVVDQESPHDAVNCTQLTVEEFDEDIQVRNRFSVLNVEEVEVNNRDVKESKLQYKQSIDKEVTQIASIKKTKSPREIKEIKTKGKSQRQLISVETKRINQITDTVSLSWEILC